MPICMKRRIHTRLNLAKPGNQSRSVLKCKCINLLGSYVYLYARTRVNFLFIRRRVAVRLIIQVAIYG